MNLSELAKINESLQQANQQLQAEIHQLKAQVEKMNSSEVIVVRKTVIPKDYDRNKKRLSELEEENENLKYILSFSGVYSLEVMIEDFNNDLQLKLKRIAQEFQNFPLGISERELIKDTIIHLHKCVQSMEALLK